MALLFGGGGFFLLSRIGFLFVLSFYDGQKCYFLEYMLARIAQVGICYSKLTSYKEDKGAWNYPIFFMDLLLLIERDINSERYMTGSWKPVWEYHKLIYAVVLDLRENNNKKS